MIYSLFEGRHALPNNIGAICSDFDFASKKSVKTPLYEELLSNLENEDCSIYVTGLTPALTELISDYYKRFCKGRLTLLHFDRDTNSYWEQVM